jgi:hypothetical protein
MVWSRRTLVTLLVILLLGVPSPGAGPVSAGMTQPLLTVNGSTTGPVGLREGDRIRWSLTLPPGGSEAFTALIYLTFNPGCVCGPAYAEVRGAVVAGAPAQVLSGAFLADASFIEEVRRFELVGQGVYLEAVFLPENRVVESNAVTIVIDDSGTRPERSPRPGAGVPSDPAPPASSQPRSPRPGASEAPPAQVASPRPDRSARPARLI